jgi:CrcB protein
MQVFFLVFLGGGLGSICRYAITLWIQPWQVRYPWATLVSNGLACFVLGALLGWQLSGQLPDRYRLLLATGFCGGFSTFSTFTAETWQLWQTGQSSSAMIYVTLSLSVCMVCLLLGLVFGEVISRG